MKERAIIQGQPIRQCMLKNPSKDLPYKIGAYAADKPRTCFEVFKFVVQLAANTSGGLSGDNTGMVRNCMMTECQAGTGANKRDIALVLKVGVAHSNTDEFARWRQ